jgi:hypothetical protein
MHGRQLSHLPDIIIDTVIIAFSKYMSPGAVV